MCFDRTLANCDLHSFNLCGSMINLSVTNIGIEQNIRSTYCELEDLHMEQDITNTYSEYEE